MNDTELMQAVDARIGELERLPDVRSREAARSAIQAVLALHREALARMLRMVGEGGPTVATRLARDPLLGSVLALHDLHPQDLSDRIQGAIESVRPLLRLNGVDIHVERLDTGDVRVGLTRAAAGCPSTATRMRKALESALDRAAPEALNIQIQENRG